MEKLRTYIDSVDDILHGGIPEYAVTVIMGEPGAGKTVLTLQTMFNNAARGARCVYFTTLSEPAPKLIRYTQMFDFFDEDLVDERFKFIDLGTPLREDGLDGVLERIVEVVEAEQPDVVAIDSFKAIHDLAPSIEDARIFVYDLAVQLSLWSANTFLVGEYDEEDFAHAPEFATADAIISLGTETQELTSLREIQVRKLRGSSFSGGTHFFDIDSSGITAYPRVGAVKEEAVPGQKRVISSGVEELDRMLGGGIPELSATLIDGGAGLGKTLLGLQFAARGANEGAPGVIFAFEETKEQLTKIAAGFGIELGEEHGVSVCYTSPVELLGARWLDDARKLVEKTGAERVVIDSLSAMNIGLLNERRFRELVYTAVKMFRGMGVTLLMTVESAELLGSSVVTGHGISATCDNIIMMRYVEVESQIRRALSVLSVRGSSHDNDLREFRITDKGIELGEPFRYMRGVLTGRPTPTE